MPDLDPFTDAVDLATFAGWTTEVLAPHGFRPDNALALVGVCRDELMFATEEALHARWGPAFDVSSLGGMVLLGRTGLAAGAHHAPGLDGRRRFVLVVLTHIGVDATDTPGAVERAGIAGASSACGALVALGAEIMAGPLRTDLDPDDPEMSLLRAHLAPLVTAGAPPGLAELTDLARRRATDELVRLAGELMASPATDTTLVSGIVVHRPGGDHVDVREAWVRLGDDPTRVALPRPAAG